MKKMTFKTFLYLILFCISGSQLAAQDRAQLRSEIDKIIRWDTEIQFERTPAFSIGIIDGDSTFFINYGNFSKEENRPINEHSIFEVGSVTKPITASLISLLAQKDVLQYSDKVNTFLPEEFQNEALSELTIDDLLTHASGFPRLPIGFGLKEHSVKDPYQNYTKEDLLHFYKKYIPSKKPKNKFLYSHVNYALLEVILELHLNKNFSDIIEKEMFAKMGMPRTAMSIIDQHHFVQGYSIGGRPSSPMNFSSFAASEGLKSSASNLTSFLKFNLMEKEENIFTLNHIKQLKSNLNKHIYSSRGWQVIDRKPYDIYFHSGKSKGHAAYVLFILETKTAVVLLANSEKGTEDLAMLILRMLNKNWKRRA